MLKAQETKSAVKFLVAASKAYPYDQELRHLCSFAKQAPRDFTCIDYSRLKKRMKQSCKVMLPPVVRVMQSSVRALETNQCVLFGKRREAVDKNSETALIIENMRLFPNVFDPTTWIQASLYTIKDLDSVVQDALVTVKQVEEILKLIEFYKVLLEMTLDEMTDFSKCVSCVVKAKKKTFLSIQFVMIEKKKQSRYLTDLYEIRDYKLQP